MLFTLFKASGYFFSCVIRKLVHNADSDKRMKLTKKRLIDSLRALEEGKTVEEVYAKYRICASRLVKRIKRDYNLHIPVYTIHKIMLEKGLAKHKEVKDLRKKKWVRYERKHSLTAVHMDWVHHPELKLWALPVIDDSTRKLLALIEADNLSTDASIDAIEQAAMHGQIKQCITDHGSEFTANERGESRFVQALENIKRGYITHEK